MLFPNTLRKFTRFIKRDSNRCSKMKKPSDMEKTFEERLAAFTLEKLEASGVPTTELEQPEMKQTIATYLDLSSPRRLAKAAPTREVQPTTKKKSQIQEHADIQERRYLEALDSFRSTFISLCLENSLD